MTAPDVRTPGGNRASAEQIPNAADSKALATLQAHAALAGYELIALAEGGFLICRWGLVRECADLAEVKHVLRRMGVAV